MVKVSFIITTRNEEAYIRSTILSILNQTAKVDKEIILVDAISTDKTVEIARTLVNKLVIEKSNISQGKNIGAKLSSGDILVFLNADVILEKEWLEKILRYFTSKNTVAVHGLIKPREKSLRARIFVLLWNLLISFSSKIKIVHVSGESTLAVKREVFFRVGGFREDLSAFEDIDIGLRISRIKPVVLAKDCFAIASLRRFEREGYLKWTLIWLSIAIYYFLRKRSLVKEYPLVR